jgi:dipeptidase E
VISGGNTFKLLDNLRKSGLDKTIIEFTKQDNYVLSGFSAGALVLTPTIEVCNLPNYDENLVGLKNLTGLGIIDFEVFPHYDEATQKELLDKYRLTAKHEVKEITNEDFITIDL